tara:strand:- start:434 stop:1021 length:588 start_codon:yes stop_codon:yes gene_type:complete
MARWKPTVYLSTPSWMSKVYSATKSNPDWTQSLRLVVVGAEASSPALLEEAAQRGTLVVEGYGITETSPVICTGMMGRSDPGVGWPIEGVDVALVVLGDYAAERKKPGRKSALLKKQIAARKEMEGQLEKLLERKEGEENEDVQLLRMRLARPIVLEEVAHFSHFFFAKLSSTRLILELYKYCRCYPGRSITRVR